MRLLVPLLSLILLFSCAEEDFDVSSLSLSGSVDITAGEETVRKETLTLRAAFSDPDESYSYRIETPDGLLWWEGGMSGDDILSSEPLELTDGASFPSGDYPVLFYSTNGTELETTVSYGSDGSYPSFTDGILSGDAYVRELDADGSVIAEGERETGYVLQDSACEAELSTVDRYGNRISVSQSFPQGA